MADEETEPEQVHALPINPPIFTTPTEGPKWRAHWRTEACNHYLVGNALSCIGERTRRPQTYLLQ
eukprot:1568604-Prorocentrum_lima.AAC.1